jgi:allophanate hydrolase
VPAAFNNIVGLKPTKGAVSTRGVVPACRSLDCVSVLALTVEDAVSVYRTMQGFDPEDAYSRPVPPCEPLAEVPPGLRIGVPDAASRRFGGDRFAERAFSASQRDLAALGISLTEVDLGPFFAAGELLYEGPWVAERYLAVGGFIEKRPEAVDPTVRGIVAAAARLSAADAFAGLHRLAELRRASQSTWRSVDALLVPTFPRPVTRAAVAADPIGASSELGTYANFVNLLDLCALAVPGRFRDDSLPAGVTLIAPAGCDARIAAVGARLQAGATAPLGSLCG